MDINQTRKERIARVLAGLCLLKSGKKLGIIPLVTGVTGYCPIKNKLLGERSDRAKSMGKCCGIRHCRHRKPSDTDKTKT